MGILKSSFLRNPNKSSQVVTSQTSSFTPSIINHPLLVNELDEGDLDTNHEVVRLGNQELDNLFNSMESNKYVDLQLKIEDPVPESALPATPLTPDHSPSPSPPASLKPPPNIEPPSSPPLHMQTTTSPIHEIQSVNPTVTEVQPTAEKQEEQQIEQ